MSNKSVSLNNNSFAKFLAILCLVAAIAVPGLLKAQSQPTIGGDVYGGGRMANVNGNAKVQMKNGKVEGSLYGGNDISGNTGNPANGVQEGNGRPYGVIVTGGTVDQNVFGGANGYYGCHGTENSATIPYTSDFTDDINVLSPSLNIPTINKTYVYIKGANVSVAGSVYGGGNLAPVSNSSANAGVVEVEIIQGTIGAEDATSGGNVFTGGNMASIYAAATGNSSQDNPLLTVNNRKGGGSYDLYIYGGVYGGNDKSGTIASADNAYKSTVTIAGAPNYIGDVFGGGNGDYTYYTDKVAFDAASESNKVFGCSTSKPDQTMGTLVTINTSGGYINRVFGGGNSATVGQPSVVINTTNDNAGENGHDGYHVGQVFGGNNSVALNAVPVITLTRGTMNEVYGGGNAGAITATSGSETVGVTNYTGLSTKILMTSANNVHVGTVYGGCNKADVSGSTLINLASASTEVGTIYGACNISGDMAGTSNVLVSDGTVTTNVFGGANGYYGCPTSNGYYNNDFDANDGVAVDNSIKMPTIASTNVVISGGTIGSALSKASVYGGGNLASVGQSSDPDGEANLTVSGGTVYGNVYAGGNMASIYGVTNFLINGDPEINGDVFGGNDKTGRVSGDGRTGSSTTAGWSDANHSATYTLSQNNAAAYVLIEGTPDINGSVFGGGNGDYTYFTEKSLYEASDAPNKVFVCNDERPVQTSAFVDLHMACGASIDKVFAGGNAATVGLTYDNSSNAIAATVFFNAQGNPLAEPAGCGTQSVGTIFGGNNKATMYELPSIDLRQGIVGNVYGGGNMGGMNGNNNSLVQGGTAVSTYVRIPSPNVLVNENVYGGCKAADVVNQTYVELDKGKVVGMIFGANDIAGTVTTANVVIDGVSVVNKVFGGGNGMYCYVPVTPATNPVTYTVTDHGETFTVAGRPMTETAKVDLRGAAKVHNNIYGGGLAGDCVNTIVNLDLADENGDPDADEEDLGILYAMVFGGGCGDVEHIGTKPGSPCMHEDCEDGKVWETHVGNVTNLATLNINTIGRMETETTNGQTTRNAIFGGGHAGDVANAMLTLNNTCKIHIPSIYGGCMASDLTGTTTMVINGAATLPAGFNTNVDTIYGGNDFSGLTNHTDLTINSGVFQHVFGAGNGAYDYKTILSSVEGDNCKDSVPYSMTVDVTYNGGEFLGTVYGGGNLGLVGNRDLNPLAVTEADKGYITVNIHGGQFDRHVFAGARGETDMLSRYFGKAYGNTAGADGQELGKELAYATKQVNMDGGTINFSLYGGSESVDDGFFYECKNNVVGTSTTLRPSSIVNIVGGEIKKSVYGGGYMGNIYGSVYVNVGIDAVNDSPVWTKTYGSYTDAEDNNVDITMAGHKPNTANGETIAKSRLSLGASIYNASDWGEAGANAYFNTRGVYGGETNILVDGQGYYTSLTDESSMDLPGMDITYSIIGAGTSTEGGDVNRLITLRHYGDYSCPNPSKSLYSIQRADKVILDHAYINLYGEQDAFSAYASPSYSFCRIDTLIFREDNVVMIESPAIYIGYLASMKDADVLHISDSNHHYNSGTLRESLPACENVQECQTMDICVKLPSERGTEGKITAANVLMMKNGSYVKVSPFVDAVDNANTSDHTPDGLDDPDHPYGHVYGYMYLLAQDQTMSYVYADYKIKAAGPTQHSQYDGGFISPCNCENSHEGEYDFEVIYVNVEEYRYRSWKVGTNRGQRTRHITLVANANPDGTLNNNLTAGAYNRLMPNNQETVDGATIPDNFAYATTTLELPPADAGSFYVINSVLIDQDNGGQLALIDEGYTATENKVFSLAAIDQVTHFDNIVSNPDYTFGLTFTGAASGSNFDNNTCWNSNHFTEAENTNVDGETYYRLDNGHYYKVDAAYITAHPSETYYTNSFTQVRADNVDFSRQLGEFSGEGNQLEFSRYACWPRSIISGNQFITNSGGYISNDIGTENGIGLLPTMNFTLTYCKDLHTTITRDVVFSMFEFDRDGNYVGPVEVTVTISTVITNFSNLEAPVMAMYNDGISDEYVRKVTIPASFKQRDIYLQGIEWEKENDIAYTTQSNGERTVKTDPEKSEWFKMIATDEEIISNQQFSFTVNPTEAAAENITNTLGWYHINTRDIDVFALANSDYQDSHGGSSLSDAQRMEYSSLSSDHLVGSAEGYDYSRTITAAEYDALDATEKAKCTSNGEGGYTYKIDREYYIGLSKAERDKFTPAGTNMAQKDQGIWIGTLDGRSTASMDVTLNFEGLRYYQNQFNPPLAYITLKFYYKNTKSDGDGYFDLKIKLRTRFEGDTIYLAPESSLTRAGITLNSYEYHIMNESANPPATVYGNLSHDASNIKNHPENYLQSFKAAMLIYEEGDVLDVMETMPVSAGDDPLSIIGDDYSIIQIIRYSGSHYTFPDLQCAHLGPLIKVTGNGFMTMRNVWFNGSGCTRTKYTRWHSGQLQGNYDHIGGLTTIVGGNNDSVYYENSKRFNVLLNTQSPVILVDKHGSVNFSTNVLISNNFNYYHETAPVSDTTFAECSGTTGRLANPANAAKFALDHYYLKDANDNYYLATSFDPGATYYMITNINSKYPGGAVAIIEDNNGVGADPQVTLGNRTNIYDNVVIDWTSPNATLWAGAAARPTTPLNYGAGVFVDGGNLTLGTGSDDTEIYLHRNFYLKHTSAGTGIQTKTVKALDNVSTSEFDVYYIDTLNNNAVDFTLSNVYLKRMPGTCPDAIRRDNQSDLVYFLSTFKEGSRVGISKYFPGYVYGTQEIPRDTIAFARIGNGKSNSSLVDKVYQSGIFFNDSSYFSTNTVTEGVPAFVSEYPEVLRNTDITHQTTGYDDHVFLFYYSTVNQYNIYFQRCATFGKGVRQIAASECEGTTYKFINFGKGDSLAYRWNSQATCSGNTDTLFFSMGGGFFPYRYEWRDYTDSLADNSGNTPTSVMRDRLTFGSAGISNPSVSYNTTLRYQAQHDSLIMVDMFLQPGEAERAFTYHVTGSDLTGHCFVNQDVTIKVVQQLDFKTYTDVDNFLGYGADYVMACPGLDSSAFHDHSATIRNQTDTEDSTIYFYPTHTMVADAGNNPTTAGTRTNTPLTRTATTEVKYLRAYRQYSIHPKVYPADIATSDTVKAYRYSLDAGGNQVETEVNLETNNIFCPGDVIELRPQILEAQQSHYNFTMWDFDATANENSAFVVSEDESLNKPIAFYEPGDYWWQAVNTEPLGFYQNYMGDIYIYNNEGLAWLISVVNGYNGQNAQTLRFNTVYLCDTKVEGNAKVGLLDKDCGDYNMVAHKWTPIGNQNNHFEGYIVNQGYESDGGAVITNIIANEENIPLMGFFGYTDSARIEGLILKDVFIKGNGYVGGLIGQATHKTSVKYARLVADSTGTGESRKRNPSSYGATLVGSNCIGGLAAIATDSRFELSETKEMHYLGNCIYVGGIVGRSDGDNTYSPVAIKNNKATGIDLTRLSALYAGGVVGYGNFIVPENKGGKSLVMDSIYNNYIEMISGDQNFRVGGLVGNAEGMDMRNNYVYGIIKGKDQSGGLVALSGDYVNIDHCYYVNGSAPQAVGGDMAAAPSNVSTFRGTGNQVLLDDHVGGYTNLTRALNGWVKEQNAKSGNQYLTWRSDLENENSGYPVFGTPDVVPVYDTLIQSVCSLFDWDGIELYESGVFTRHIVDSLDYLDSTATLMLTVYYPDSTEVEDSVSLGNGYDGYGFHFSADEIRQMIVGQRSTMMLVVSDTLQTLNGCDSVVTLTLYFSNGTVDINEAEPVLREVKVYPNPTRGLVNVEGDGIQSVELYDATSRRLLRKQVEGDEIQLDLSGQATGSYYIRVNTSSGSVVKKLIKK